MKGSLTDILTTTQINLLLALKSDKENTYTIEQVNTALNLKSNITDVYNKIYLYTKDELNTLLLTKLNITDFNSSLNSLMYIFLSNHFFFSVIQY